MWQIQIAETEMISWKDLSCIKSKYLWESGMFPPVAHSSFKPFKPILSRTIKVELKKQTTKGNYVLKLTVLYARNISLKAKKSVNVSSMSKISPDTSSLCCLQIKYKEWSVTSLTFYMFWWHLVNRTMIFIGLPLKPWFERIIRQVYLQMLIIFMSDTIIKQSIIKSLKNILIQGVEQRNVWVN